MSVSVSEGDLLSDRFRLVEFLDEGGVSKVWTARDEQTGTQVIVKFPNYDSENHPKVVKESIEREIDVLEAIEASGGHPNLMRLVARVDMNGQPGMVVEYVHGQDLYSAVKRENGFTNPEDVRRIGIDLCRAMSFLHEHEIIYRDLKPDNVMLQPDLTPVLIDFNTAKGFIPDPSGDTRSGTVIPNPTYKPPELNNDPELVGFRQGPWSDVYSIGKVLMFIFSASAARGDGIDPRDFPGSRSVPAYLAECIKRSTQAHKDDRYRNATVLARLLENRTAEPPDLAMVTFLQEDTTYDVYPGDTIGRDIPDGPRPAIGISDPQSHISAVQAQFDVDHDDSWLIRDRSLNGTWIRRDDKWHRLISDRGRERLQKRADSPEEIPGVPDRMRVKQGDIIALVHPEYGVWLRFEGTKSA